MKSIAVGEVLESQDLDLRAVATHARGPAGALPLTPEMLLTQPSGNLFGMTMNAGMGWDPARMGGPEVLILSTHGGLRAEDGTPIALGFHSGHWEVGLLVAEAARELKGLDAVPFAGACTDPCDGRTQGTTGMLDSLPYRNDAAIVLRRLMRSLPTRDGVLGIATCDKGLPAMMMALASSREMPCGAGPWRRHAAAGGRRRRRARCRRLGRALRRADHAGVCGGDGVPRVCVTGRRMPVSGHGSDVAGGGRGAGAALPHTALAPSGQPIWLDAAKRSAAALLRLRQTRTRRRATF